MEKRHRSGFMLRRRPVLLGVDLGVARGERLGLLGPNGSGKSTLLRIAAGVDRADAGTVRVLEGSPGEARVRRRLGWLPEDSPFPRELGGRTALALCASVRGLPRPRAHAQAWLERLGLADAARTPLGRYSRGMLRRFGLAQAFFHDPDLVLLDEPTAGLDAQGHVALQELLDEARARGAGIVLASHVPADVFGGCDRAAVLLDGRIAIQGTPRELLVDDGRRVLELEGLPAAGLEAARDALGRLGVRVVGELPSPHAVLELYRGSGPRATHRGDGANR